MPVLWGFGKKKQQRARERVSGREGARPVRHARPQEIESEWIGTRRHFSNLPYILPKDALEADRLNFQHYYLKAVFKSLYLAPLERKRLEAVLDVGCGTGRWAHEMAQACPRARVIGLDVDVPLPGALPAPPNFTFAQGNVLEQLPFANSSFDFVHQRLLVAAIPAMSWTAVVAELTRVTRPGGWIELVEAGDIYLNAGPALGQFLSWSRVVSGARGIDAGRVAYLDDLLVGAGLSHVEKHVHQVPLGRWGGRLGHMLAQDTIAVFEGLRGLYCQAVPMSPEQFDATLAILPAEWNTYRTEFSIFAAYGQRQK